MEKHLSNPTTTIFEQIREVDENSNEYWGARRISKVIVQNAYPSKEVVAMGQTYFAVQTRLQEISKMEE